MRYASGGFYLILLQVEMCVCNEKKRFVKFEPIELPPQVQAALMKSLGVYMSLRGHLDWFPRRHSMFSGTYGHAADGEQQYNENHDRSGVKSHFF